MVLVERVDKTNFWWGSAGHNVTFMMTVNTFYPNPIKWFDTAMQQGI